MSFINFSITHTFTAGAMTPTPRFRNMEIGFGRDGRIDTLTRTSSGRDRFEGPTKERVKVTPEIATAAESLKGALSGASWVQDVDIKHGDGIMPDPVSWTYKSGRGDHAMEGKLPASVQQVLDAASALETAIRDASIDRPARG